MASEGLAGDAARFFVAGSLNTVLTSFRYFVNLTVVPSVVVWAVVWLAGLAFGGAQTAFGGHHEGWRTDARTAGRYQKQKGNHRRLQRRLRSCRPGDMFFRYPHIKTDETSLA